MKTDLDQLMQENNVDALWVMGSMSNNPDMVYFTGIHYVNQVDLFKLRGREPLVYHFVDMEREEAAKSGLETHSYDEKYPLDRYLKAANNDLNSALARRMKDVLEEIGVFKGRIAISGWDNLSTAFALIEGIRALLPEIEFFSFLKDSPIRKARMTKTSEEVEHIRRMGKITIEVVARTANFLSSCPVKDNFLLNTDGKALTIANAKHHINTWLAELGAENPEETIFAIGRDAGIPHSTGNPQDLIEKGKPIVFDIFPREAGGGYFYDFTRTWCLGYASAEVERLHDQVLQVHHQIISELQPGQPFKKYQSRACELFTMQGHATVEQQFNISEGYVHSIGHGLGLEVHENPFSGITASDDDLLLPGVVFSIEPGLYYPSKDMGMRLEDTVYLNPEGKFEVLADYPYDLILPVKK